MEEPPSSECAPAVGSDDEQEGVCDGFGVDGQWEYQRVCRYTQGCESVRACGFSQLTPFVADEIVPGSLKESPGDCYISMARG